MADNTCGNKIKKGEKKEGKITRCKGKGKDSDSIGYYPEGGKYNFREEEGLLNQIPCRLLSYT
jgi:hypothetical protein